MTDNDVSTLLICSSTSEIVPKDKLPPIVTLPLISASLVTVIADKSVAPRMIFSTSFVTAFRLLSTLSVRLVKLDDTSIVCALISSIVALFSVNVINVFNDASTLSVNVNKSDDISSTVLVNALISDTSSL